MRTTVSNEDLTYIRELAEAGQAAPLLGGRFLAWWGGLVTLAYAGHFAIASGLAGIGGGAAYAYLWAGFALVGIIGYLALIRTLGAKPGQASAGNRAEATVWMIAGFTLFAYFGTLTVKAVSGGDAVAGFTGSLPLVFSAYAIGLFTSGAMARNGVLKAAAFGALGMVALSTWFNGGASIWAIAALGAFLTVFVPGVVMLLREPKSVI